MISIEDARQQGKVLAEASQASPIRMIASMMRVRAAEWETAAKWAEDAVEYGEDAVIVPAASIEPGNKVYWGGSVCDVIRVTNGGTGIQIAEPGFGARWENRFASQSPVVIVG